MTSDMAGNSVRIWTDEEFEAEYERRRLLDDAEADRLAEVAESLDADGPDALAARLGYLRFLQETYENDEVLELAEPLIADSARILGPDHPTTIAARALQAMTLVVEGGPEAAHAADTLANLVNEQLRAAGPDDPDTLWLRRRHAWHARYQAQTSAPDAYDAGLRDRALQLWADVVAEHVRVLGPDHPDTLAARDEQTEDFCELSEHDLEVAGYAALAADRARILGPDHPETLRSRERHASSLGETGRAEDLAEGARLYDAIVADYVRVLGPESWEAQEAMSMRATWFVDDDD